MKMVLSLVLATVMVISMFTGLNINSNAISAKSYTLGNTQSGSITSSNTEDTYKFTIYSSGRINLNYSSYINRQDLYLVDANSNEMWSYEYLGWNDNTHQTNRSENIDLLGGTYYFIVKKSYEYTGTYCFKITFNTAGESFDESNTYSGNNNSINKANSINLSTTYYGQMAVNDDNDVYKFTISTSGRVTIKYNSSIIRQDLYLVDANSNEMWSYEYLGWNDNTHQTNRSENIDLLGGTYYFIVGRSYEYTGNYNFIINFKTAVESFNESNTYAGNNNEFSAANTISLATKYTGQLAVNDDADIYKFKVSSTGNYKLEYNSFISRQGVFVMNESGKEIWSDDYLGWSDNSKQASVSRVIKLFAGNNYYILIKKTYEYTGNYSFSISHNITVNRPTSLRCSSRATTAEKVSWNKASGASGYQVQISNNTGNKWDKWFLTSSNSYTFKSLTAGGKYKFRVRAYKTYNGKKYFSAWSSTLVSPAKPATVKIKAVTSPKKGLIKTNWAKAGGMCTGYQILYGRNKSFTSIAASKKLAGQSNTAYTGKNFTKGRIYYVKVRAYTALGGNYYYGAWSAAKVVKSK